MSEYWKSTPKYWCKYCSTYVRDTKLERTNHEATAKHQGGLKRFLRDLHRSHEQEQREKDRAYLEVERLNSIVSGSSTWQPPAPSGTPVSSSHGSATVAQREKQREQLAEMGITVPTALRGDMAMPGEWTVTSRKIVTEENPKIEQVGLQSALVGVRKREYTEEQRDEDEAVDGLFKRRRNWGRDSKTAPTGVDTELDALLRMPLVKPKDTGIPSGEAKKEKDHTAGGEKEEKATVKEEIDEDRIGVRPPESTRITSSVGEPDGHDATVAITFKARKRKNIRQK